MRFSVRCCEVGPFKDIKRSDVKESIWRHKISLLRPVQIMSPFGLECSAVLKGFKHCHFLWSHNLKSGKRAAGQKASEWTLKSFCNDLNRMREKRCYLYLLFQRTANSCILKCILCWLYYCELESKIQWTSSVT